MALTFWDIVIVVTLAVIMALLLITIVAVAAYFEIAKKIQSSQQYKTFKRLESVASKLNSLSDEHINDITQMIENLTKTKEDTPNELHELAAY